MLENAPFKFRKQGTYWGRRPQLRLPPRSDRELRLLSEPTRFCSSRSPMPGALDVTRRPPNRRTRVKFASWFLSEKTEFLPFSNLGAVHLHPAKIRRKLQSAPKYAAPTVIE